MNRNVFFESRHKWLLAAVAALLPFAAAQAGGEGGHDPYGKSATGMSADRDATKPAAPSPLGFELPAPGPRGVAGPVRTDPFTESAADQELRRLGGIGGSDTN